jgi:hypothetical protein
MIHRAGSAQSDGETGAQRIGSTRVSRKLLGGQLIGTRSAPPDVAADILPGSVASTAHT